MADDARARYLAELDATLPMPRERRAEVVEEINAHLEDAVAAQLERGRAPDEAEEMALERLGPPRDLAADLARPEQSPWRLLAAVGAGVRTGIGQWIYGFLLASLVLLLAVYLVAATAQLSARLLELEWQLGFTDQGWNTLFTTGAIATGLYFAGRAMPNAVSVASHRLVGTVRPWVVGFGTLAAAGLLITVVEVPLNWASALGMALAPAAFSLGATRPNLLPERVLWPLPAIIGGFLLLTVLGLLTTGQGVSGAASETETAPIDRGLGVVGPWWVDPTTAGEPLLWSTAIGEHDGEGQRYEWELSRDDAVDGLRDLRVEAWHSEGAPYGRLAPGQDRPFATAPITRDGRLLSASLDTESTPGVSNWELIVTGVGPDGRRYVVDAGTGLSSTFTGSVLDWLVAVAQDR